jgi:tetratricopeptide (TPR) repeat protein
MLNKDRWLALGAVCVLSCLAAKASQPVSDLRQGESYYTAGEFKKAISCLKRSISADPFAADAYYLAGKSYELLADIEAAPFDHQSRRRAHHYLATAVRLAPGNEMYRRELFDFLLDAYPSRNSISEAEDLLERVPEWDPEYPLLEWRLIQAKRERLSAAYQAGQALLAGPRQLTTVFYSSPSLVPKPKFR